MPPSLDAQMDKVLAQAQAQAPKPGAPLEIKRLPSNLDNTWIMFFRHGMNANLTKGFYCEGGLFAAETRAKEHCKVMNYRYIWVRPLICNLEEEETHYLGGTRGQI